MRTQTDRAVAGAQAMLDRIRGDVVTETGTERVSWRRLVAEIALADHLPMPTSIDLVGDPVNKTGHVSLWTFTEGDKTKWERFTHNSYGLGRWHGWDVSVSCTRRETPADALDDATKAALAAVE